VYPSLEEMTRTALKALSAATKDSEKGFFIMIEGSRIDHAGHANDPVAQVHEVLAYDRAFAAAVDFLENDSTPGVLVSTSDHETGGLAAARQLHESYPVYHWFPGALVNASHSSEHLDSQLQHYLSGDGQNATRPERRSYIRLSLLEDGLGIVDATDDEVDQLIDAGGTNPARYIFADMISRRAQVGWSTHGHSAVDVNIYASSPDNARPLVGNHENTKIGEFIADYLSLDLDSVTRQLKHTSSSPGSDGASSKYSWMGKAIEDEVVVDKLDSYHGDFRR